MGQKIHPHGLRIAINRKWNQSWFAKGSEWKDLFYHQKQVESFFKSFFYLYPYTKLSTTRRVLLVDLKLYKYNNRQLFLFIFFYKLRTKRRRNNKTYNKFSKKQLWTLKIQSKLQKPVSNKENIAIKSKSKFVQKYSLHNTIFNK